MKLFFGGAYQGKQEYVMQTLAVEASEIYTCVQAVWQVDDFAAQSGQVLTLPDFHKKAIARLEVFVWNCIQTGEDAVEQLKQHRELWQDKIFICTDISSGVVPLQPEERAWREMTGRVLIYLGQEADEVTRIFCGLPQRIKG